MTPDFERLADVVLARVYQARRDGLLAEHDVVVAALRDLWNARGSGWSGLMAGFAPAPTDRSSTGTFDHGGPTGVEADG